jgi:hypothetical protein
LLTRDRPPNEIVVITNRTEDKVPDGTHGIAASFPEVTAIEPVVPTGTTTANPAHSTTARPRGATTMRTDAHNMGREERRALLEQRRAVVARQLRRLAIELTDLDRQLDDIKHSQR